MASSAAGVKADRPSFAKIAAAGLKPPGTKLSPTSHENTQAQQIISSPPDGANILSHSTGSHPTQFTPKQKKLVPLSAKEQRGSHSQNDNLLQVSIHDVDTASADAKMLNVTEGTLVAGLEEAGTQVSSSSGSGKPPSLDGKSVASGTTFALDEKESLRPDDSASVKAGDDEELFSPPGSGLPGSRIGSEDGTKAFRDQLREISCMGPSRQPEARPAIARGPSQGVLYVPPHGPGVGSVPDANRPELIQDSSVECLPDTKLLEALESPKDRIMVLKLEQDFVDFVKDPKEASLTLPHINSYHRMLAHRLADYYMLGHIVEDSAAVQIYKTATCRLAPPLTAIAPPSTAASTPPPTGPQMKILRRGDNVGPTIANGSNTQSKTGSENGESGNDDEKKKYPLSREEREAKYEAARKRIMGSARPSEATDEQSEKDNSRSSSTAPKKAKKKQRNDSDDDFEARSAYSAYYAAPFTSAGPAPAHYGFTHAGIGQESQFVQPAFNHQMSNTNSQQYCASAGVAWQNQAAFQHQQQQSPSPWISSPHQPYDLSNDFQRAMSMQSPPMSSPQAGAPPNWQTQQQQPYGGPPQQWQGQNPYPSGFQSHVTHSHADNFRPSSSSSQTQKLPYAYGQLPSQTFPGRPPSNLEHPLPGSYKGKHFNPQSQSFIPNYTAPQSHAMPMQAFMSQVPQAGQAQYGSQGVPSPMQQANSYPQSPAFQQQQTPFRQPYSPYQQQQHTPYQQQLDVQQQHQVHMPSSQAQQTAAPITAHRSPAQPMTHPLPQPVFPRQPSPNLPLPPKPDATPPKPSDRNGSSGQEQQQSKESTIAKWGAPSSLPAKPPPAVEPFDAARFAHNQRQSSHGSSRIPSGSSGYGQVPAGAGRM